MIILYRLAIKGHQLDISNAPDETFSLGLLGKGFVIFPEDDMLYAPIDGKITLILPTKHAIAIEHASGISMLIHIGFETNTLNGLGIDLFVQKDQIVKRGDLLAKIDLPYINQHAKSSAISLVFVQKNQLTIIKETVNNDMIELELDIK